MEKAQDSGSGLKDAIVTLPAWGIALLALLCAGSIALVTWVVVYSGKEELKGSALQLLIVIIPLSSAIVAAIAMRRTSTRQIDRLVTAFLERTLLERFEAWTAVSRSQAASRFPYPFSVVRLCEPTLGRSYAYYSFSEPARGHEFTVGAKCNVFNFEVFSTVPLHLPHEVDASAVAQSIVADAKTHEAVRSHAVLGQFFGLIQGSVNEGYELRFSFTASDATVPPGRKAVDMQVSLRQKVRENFLASPFLKRYFAEDAAIAVGVLFNEWRASGFMPVAADCREACREQ